MTKTHPPMLGEYRLTRDQRLWVGRSTFNLNKGAIVTVKQYDTLNQKVLVDFGGGDCDWRSESVIGDLLEPVKQPEAKQIETPEEMQEWLMKGEPVQVGVDWGKPGGDKTVTEQLIVPFIGGPNDGEFVTLQRPETYFTVAVPNATSGYRIRPDGSYRTRYESFVYHLREIALIKVLAPAEMTDRDIVIRLFRTTNHRKGRYDKSKHLNQAGQAAFEAFADQFDTDSDEWQDMGADEYFIAGYQAAIDSLAPALESDSVKQATDDHRPRWVCEMCIGTDEFEELTIGLIGQERCSVCQGLFPQPTIALVPYERFLEAKKRDDPGAILG